MRSRITLRNLVRDCHDATSFYSGVDLGSSPATHCAPARLGASAHAIAVGGVRVCESYYYFPGDYHSADYSTSVAMCGRLLTARRRLAVAVWPPFGGVSVSVGADDERRRSATRRCHVTTPSDEPSAAP